MEQQDPKLESRVWQRVHAAAPPIPEPDGATLLALIGTRQADATAYGKLQKQFSGQKKAILQNLQREELSHVACLKGIYTLITGQRAQVPQMPLPQERPSVTLRRCYGNEMRCLVGYESHAAHPEYGQVFARLAEQKRSHCMQLLQVLGMEDP